MMSEDKYESIRQKLKFYDPQLCFQMLDFYLNNPSFTNQSKEFHLKLKRLREDFLFNQTNHFDLQEKYLKENESKNFNQESIEEQKLEY